LIDVCPYTVNEEIKDYWHETLPVDILIAVFSTVWQSYSRFPDVKLANIGLEAL